jgi:hypothetical protein
LNIPLSSGIEYTLGRVPMAGCDFSTREYSYNDVDGDFNMTNFALTDEDMQYKVGDIIFDCKNDSTVTDSDYSARISTDQQSTETILKSMVGTWLDENNWINA